MADLTSVLLPLVRVFFCVAKRNVAHGGCDFRSHRVPRRRRHRVRYTEEQEKKKEKKCNRLNDSAYSEA